MLFNSAFKGLIELSLVLCIIKLSLNKIWAQQLSKYNDWLRAGRYGNRIPVGARFSAPVQTVPGAHPASCTTGTGSFPRVKSGRGVTLTPHSLLVPLVMKEQSYTSTPSMGRTACTEPQCLYKGDLYLYLLIKIVGFYVFRSVNCDRIA